MAVVVVEDGDLRDPQRVPVDSRGAAEVSEGMSGCWGKMTAF